MNKNTKQTKNQVQRSASQSDIPGTHRRIRSSPGGTKLKRCASLPAQKHRIVPEDKRHLKTQLESSVESLGMSHTYITFMHS